MIVPLHVAIGAATGAVSRSRPASLALGPLLHIVGDQVPHRHPKRPVWELLTGAFALGFLAGRRGVLDPATLGAFAAAAPDAEHLLPLRVRGRKVLHLRPGRDRHDGTGLSAQKQMLLAAGLIAALLISTKPTPQAKSLRGT
jgi:hypothetical protein